MSWGEILMCPQAKSIRGGFAKTNRTASNLDGRRDSVRNPVCNQFEACEESLAPIHSATAKKRSRPRKAGSWSIRLLTEAHLFRIAFSAWPAGVQKFLFPPI